MNDPIAGIANVLQLCEVPPWSLSRTVPPMYELGLAIQQFFEGIVTYVWERHGPFFGIFTAFGLVAMLIGLVVLAIHYSTDLAALF